MYGNILIQQIDAQFVQNSPYPRIFEVIKGYLEPVYNMILKEKIFYSNVEYD